MLGFAEVALACTWTAGACPAAADIADPDSSEPTTPSAKTAGTMIVRLMRMIPPGRFPRSGARCTGPPACTAYLPSCGVVSQILVISCVSDNHFLTFLE